MTTSAHPQVFYQPRDGWAADFIPFFWRGRYHLFYLKDWRDPAGHGAGVPWWHVSTADFVAFEDHGEALPRGGADEQDLLVFTGSVVEADGRFHIFYTGANGAMAARGGRNQAILHATSPDLVRWTKDRRFVLESPAERFEPHDWRDPFVFWNDAAGEYWMLVTARLNHGPALRRGCIALCRSRDLARWEVGPPLWTPHLHQTHECPDLFRIGDWWYLVYSTVSTTLATHYRMARGPAGPWLPPPGEDTFDGRGWYAAKTAGDGRRRFIFGWNSTKSENKDDGAWQWGGALAVHEIVQGPDGALAVRCPESVAARFDRPLAAVPQPQLGRWEVASGRCRADARDGFAWCRLGQAPAAFRLDTTIRFDAGTRSLGVLFKIDEGCNDGYNLILEPGRQRMLLIGGGVFHAPFLMERPLELVPGRPVRLRLLVDGSIVEVYADDRAAMSARAYHDVGAHVGLFVSEGAAEFTDAALATLR